MSPEIPYEIPEAGSEQYRRPSTYSRARPAWFTTKLALGDEYKELAGTYFERRDVLPPEQTTWNDRPIDETDFSTYRFEAYDRRAFQQLQDGDKTALIGKWRLTRSAESVDDTWQCILDECRRDILGAKVSTAGHVNMQGYAEHLIVVYTPNYFDVNNVMDVREALSRAGIESTIYYKPDLFSQLGINEDNYDEQTDLPFPGRFRA